MGIGIRLSQRSELANGQPISDLMSLALNRPDVISLAAGFVDQATLPAESTKAALDALYGDPTAMRAALQYGTTPGYPPLREMLLDDLRKVDGLAESQSVQMERIVCTTGSNQLLHLVSESLIDPGDIVLCAAPTYLVYLGTLANVGARTIGVETDQQGIVPDQLEAEIRRIEKAGELERIKVIYVVTYFDNPGGVTMSADRRRRIVEIAKRWSKRHSIHIIEDAAYRELRYAGQDVPSMHSFDEDGTTVILAGTFSKSYSPGIRVGWGILPEHLVEAVCQLKGNIDFGSPNFSQQLMAKVLELGLYESHIDEVRRGYRPKLAALLQAIESDIAPIDGSNWVAPLGGLYVWLRLPEQLDAGPRGRLFNVAMEEGMFYVPGEYCYPIDGIPAKRNTMRLSFGVQSADGIRRGIESLKRAMTKVLENQD